EMLYSKIHKEHCLKNIDTIKRYFELSKDDHNKLIQNLCQIDGIKVTIASGLIWSAFPKERVPFDKYTLTYALDQKIIPSNKVKANYENYSKLIAKYCDDFLIGKRKFTIEDFVREALIELEETEFLIEPE
ncbi:MAG: hypothetical protein ACK53Y_28260, partial [bacterium]